MSTADDNQAAPPQCREDSRARAQAVSALFREHNRTLVRFLESRLQNTQEAREIAQEAYVRLLELGRTGAVGFLRSYLFRIASNLAIDRLRSRSAHRRIDATLIEPVEELVDRAGVEGRVFAEDEMKVFWRSLEELPEHYRQSFVLSRLHALSTADIAHRLGRSDRMVRRYIVHALIYCRHRVNGLSARRARECMEDE
jgi:RNA polymerase sigma-70 factor (ECF subfamily)